MFNRRKTQYVNPLSRASDPVGVRLNPDKLRYFREQGWHWLFRWLLRRRTPDEAFTAYLAQGDSRAAVVLQTEPDLIVAAYTDEMDAVLLLRFPTALIEQYELVKGQRLKPGCKFRQAVSSHGVVARLAERPTLSGPHERVSIVRHDKANG